MGSPNSQYCAFRAAHSRPPEPTHHPSFQVNALFAAAEAVSRSTADGEQLLQTLINEGPVADLLDGPAMIPALVAASSSDVRTSYLSLQSAWDHLREWCDAAGTAAQHCHTEYDLLIYLGALGHPIEVERRAATQMDPYAMRVARIRTAPADTASLSCALRSEQPVVPPEGGAAVEDLLVLVDPDAPRASRLVAGSALLARTYSSVVLCRDLHMCPGSGLPQRLALHGHALLACLQPAGPSPALARRDLEAQLRRRFRGRAHQCAACGFGPIDHAGCGDLEAHHGEEHAPGVAVSNACPRCGWFAEDIGEWPAWDGTVPPDAAPERGCGAGAAAAEGPLFTDAALELALRICYSVRAIWGTGSGSEAQALCRRLANWGDSLTAADGVEHPVQLLLALACADDVPEGALETPAVLALVNEVCARQARAHLRQAAGTEAPAIAAAARDRVGAFLAVTAGSAPAAAALDSAEPAREAVRESCSGDYGPLTCSAFDFEAWVRKSVGPWLPAIVFLRRLRGGLARRGGGWARLSAELEARTSGGAGVTVGARDLLDELRAPEGPGSPGLEGEQCSMAALLEVPPRSLQRVRACMAAQAFLHNVSEQRRVRADGGQLEAPLGDVRDGETLREIAKDLRMHMYSQSVAAKMQQWHRVGAEIVVARARAADIGQYESLLGAHAHGLDRPTFWGLWAAARADGHSGDKVRMFLSKANIGFQRKHG